MGNERSDAERAHRAALDRLEFLLAHDQLTGLPGADLARRRFDEMRTSADAEHHRVAFLFVDVDRFRTINDAHGHAGGDEFLRHTAATLQSVFAGHGLATRIAGNEFLIVAGNMQAVADVSTLIGRARAALEQDYQLAGHPVRCTVSIGVALYPDDGSSFDDLRDKAEMAKRLARRSGRNSILFHTAGMVRDLEERRRLGVALTQALQLHELFMRYQPQVDLASRRIVGLEALVRWERPGLGEMTPNHFIPFAEESGLIVDVGPETFRLVCADLRAWHGAGIAVPVSVNLSPIEIAHGDADTRLLEIVERSGLPPELLAIEITESGLIDETAKTEVTIANLRETGIGLSIDDFLTGYSNFAYIRRFQATHLKIDRSFVTHIDAEPDNRAIVRAAVQMASALGIATVAEGIETEAEAQVLTELGCNIGQGYLFSRPALARDIQRMLTDGTCR